MKQLFLTIFALLILNISYAQVKATSSEISTGTDDDKFATALALQGSKYLDQNGGKVSAVTAAGANTYIASIAPAITAYSLGQVFYIKITTANTGASTLNLNGLGAKALVKDASTALVAGDLLANKVYTVYYDGVNFQVMNAGAAQSAEPYSLYNYTNGAFIQTDMSGSNVMFTLHIKGNGYYTTNSTAFNIDAQGYNYDAGNVILNAKATSTGITKTVSMFLYNGFICFWIPQGSASETIIATAYASTGSPVVTNRVTSITNAAIPSTGVTRLVTVTPVVSYTDLDPIAKYVLGTNTAIANTDNIAQAFGKAQAQINATKSGYLPLTGGVLQSAVGNKLVLKKSASGQTNFLEFQDESGVREGYIGVGASLGSNINVTAYVGNSLMLGSNNTTKLTLAQSDIQAIVPFNGTSATFSGSASAPIFTSNTSTPQTRGLYTQTAGVNRWGLLTTGIAETGSNLGSNFVITRHSDDGTMLGSALSIARQTGNAIFGGTVTAATFIGALTGNASSASAVAWPGVTGKPTTLTGYGITDAATQASVTTVDANAVHKTGNETIAGIKLFSTSVGIGTTNVHTYKLAVGGGIIAESVKVKPQGEWPDYVFEKDYPILPLNELEKFVSKNKHLPNVPNAAEVKKDGIDVGEMNAKLLQKIEELTLYIIDQQKEIKSLKTNELRLSKAVEGLSAEMNLLKNK
ncbi:hypothetical protein [Pedobacter nyackensis]|uniref:hypothetical protein n=1 Tax=Pedobacter nyackensis TaxID=475255 RepID=UPI00292F77F2|nr:hypothetical protein [Pedobacter nyackensis]